MNPQSDRLKIYDGEGDRLIEGADLGQRIILLPDVSNMRDPSPHAHIRVMWGQVLLEDILAGRYRTLVCAVNAEDNSHGIISQLARLLPTSQWDGKSITQYAQMFSRTEQPAKVLKYDLDVIEILAVLRPPSQDHLTLSDLSSAFKLISEMIRRRTDRRPSAAVSFLGARANRLLDSNGREPSFETVLRTMYDSGYMGDVYPAPGMWESAPTSVYARFPFPESVESMRQGGF